MAAGMFGSSNPLMSGRGGQAVAGDNLPEAVTDSVSFKSINSDNRSLRLLPTPWPDDNLPPPTASLLAIASRNELLAALSPSQLIIAQTKHVRQDLTRKDGSKEEASIKGLSRSMNIDLPQRCIHVAFSSDEKYLVISTEQSGGLQGYETANIKQNITNHAFHIQTNNIPIRAVVPNPAEDQAHLFAIVLADGKLMIANLKDGNFLNSAQGSPILKDAGVSCCSWSAKGKQLVAGLQDGSTVQMKPDGSVQCVIPKPPPTDDAARNTCFVESILWLDNYNFLIIYNSHQDKMDPFTYVVMRNKDNNVCGFRGLDLDPVNNGCNDKRQRPHYFVNRLRGYDPALKDVLFYCSTDSADIGLLVNSTVPLDSSTPDSANNYTAVQFTEDYMKAQVPATVSEMEDYVSTIGMVIDLSADEGAVRPIAAQTDAFDVSPHPLPAMLTLTHQGILGAFWFVYNQAIIENQIYHGMNQAPRNTTAAQQTPASTVATPPQSAFGQSGTPSQPAFGRSGFGTTSTPTATTQPLGLGASPWGGSQARTPAFGAPAFGSPSQPSQPAFGAQSTPSQPAFGSTSGLGGTNRVFGGVGNASTPTAFGASANQSSTTPKATPFGGPAASNNNNTASPFSRFNQPAQNASPFGQSSNANPTFGSGTFGQTTSQPIGFGQPEKKDDKPPAFAQQPSTGSTMTIGSSFGSNSFGQPSGLGSNASVWTTTPQLGSNQTSDGVKAAAGSAQNEDADMDMDKKTDNVFGSGIAGLGLGENNSEPAKVAEPFKAPEPAKAPEMPSEEPKIKEEPVDDAPLPPDPSASAPKASTPPPPAPEEPPLPPEPAPLPPPPTAKKATDDKDAAKTPEKAPPEEASTTPKSPPKHETPTKDDNNEDAKKDEHSPAGSEPELVEAERSVPASPTRSIATEDDPTIDLSKAGTWPRRGSPVHHTPGRSVFGGGEGTPTGSFSFGQTPTTEAVKPPVMFPRPGDASRSPSPVRQQPPTGRRIASPTRRGTPSPTRPRVPSPERSASSQPAFAPAPRQPTSRLANQFTPAGPSRTPSETPVDFGPAQDAEDRLHATLQDPLTATRTLKAFIAHADYVDDVNGHSIPSQIERLYRDGNSMIDTLGLNARTLAEFIKGQNELYEDKEKDLDDLDEAKQDGWTFPEIPDLQVLQNELHKRLDAERIGDVREKMVKLRDTHRDAALIHQRRKDIVRAVAEQRAVRDGLDETARTGKPKAKLSPEQSAQLRKLRRQFADVQALIRQAEDAATLLRAKVVAGEARRDGEGDAREMPTVEAVVNTVAKMTRMAEGKRTELDVLEARLKRLQSGRSMRGSMSPSELSASVGRMSLGAGARRSVRMETPRKSVRSTPSKPRSGVGFSYSDDEDDDSVVVKRENSAEDEDLANAAAGLNIKMGVSGLSPEELAVVRDREKKKRDVLAMFKTEVLQRGPRIRDCSKA